MWSEENPMAVYLPDPVWELTKSFLFPGNGCEKGRICFPDPVWERIKALAVEFCPRCGGECVLPGLIPCWRMDLCFRHPYAFLDPYVYRRNWFSRGGLALSEPPRLLLPESERCLLCL